MSSRHATPYADRYDDVAVPQQILLVAIDVDGTLLRSDKQLTRRTASAVAESVANGVRVVLASARPPRSTRGIYSHLCLDTLAINYNGALINDPVRSRHLFHQALDADLVRRIVRAARRLHRDLIIGVEILDRWYTDHDDPDLARLPAEMSRRFAPDFIGPLDAFLQVPVTRLMLLAPAPRLVAQRKMLRRKFAGQVGLESGGDPLIAVVHPAVDKAHALSRVARSYGVPSDRVMSIGDAANDVGMLRWAGLGVAVENGTPEALNAADAVAPANDDDGVAYALRRWALGERD